MRKYLQKLIALSRPHFWIYLAGPFLVGVATTDFFVTTQDRRAYLLFLIFLFYFFVIGNVMIYGVNDIADTDTDALNEKKGTYELRHKEKDTKQLFRTILLSQLGFHLLVWLILPSNFHLQEGLLRAWGAFYFTSLFYSLPPIRAKAHPLIDSVFNVLYIIPGIIGFLQFGGDLSRISRTAFAGAWLWCMAMHTYSAIPDIEPDQQAGITTTAVLFGEKNTLFWCLFLWIGAAVLSFPILGILSLLGALVYSILIFTSFNRPVFEVYKRFPWVNGVLGFLIFWFILLSSL